MTRPTAIQKQADNARNLQEDLAARTPIEIVSSNEPNKPTPAQEPGSEYVSDNPNPQLPPAAGEQPPAASDAAPAAPSEDNWEHKYKVLQGKFNSQMERYNDELRRANDTIANLNNLIVSMNQPGQVQAHGEQVQPGAQEPASQ